jgi:hypothetical protein
MQWTIESDQNDRNVHQALVLQLGEPLAPAYVEYWKRILSDGCSNAATWGWQSLSIQMCERQSDEDSPGWMEARFDNAQRRACAGAGRYFLRSDAFTCLQGGDEDNKAFDKKQIRWLLEQYRELKAAARTAGVQQLLQQINTIRPLSIDAATSYGWFDLQVGQDSFGPLPDEDQAMLAGNDPVPGNPLLDLIGGDDMMTILQEFNAALIAYTPPNFDVIDCQITEGIEQGQRALFYNIQCPNFPDDGTSVVNDRVHKAATRLVRQMAPAAGAFPGVTIRLEQQSDGNWRHSLQVMSKAA